MDGLALFHGPNAAYALDLYDRYLQDPSAVDEKTRALFDGLPEPFIVDDLTPSDGYGARVAASNGTNGGRPASSPSVDPLIVANTTRVARNIRGRGHLAALLDPLGAPPPGNATLTIEGYGLTAAQVASLPAIVAGQPASDGLNNALEVIDRLRTIYEGATGYDYSHVHDIPEHRWLRDAVEKRTYATPLTNEEKRALLRRLTQVEVFETYLHQAFQRQKRFSIEGSDMLVPMLDVAINAAAAAGTGEVVMGMAHRGRLNVLAHVLEKPYETIFAEFREAAIGQGPAPTEGNSRGWTGDVKYHLGATGQWHEMRLALASNPSHLEYVDPVVVGMARAAQDCRDIAGPPPQDITRALPILMHGDAAFPGEGVVAETLNLSQLDGYKTGGTLHIINNNGLGFTTMPHDARSTLYASDLAKGFEIPIIHVNADDVEACVAAMKLAHAYREQFHKDVLVDLVGYRRWGHNEGDEPAFTQPAMYDDISAHPTVRTLWAERLVREGVVTAADVATLVDEMTAHLRDVNKASAGTPLHRADEDGDIALIDAASIETAIPAETLTKLNDDLLNWPAGLTPHPRLAQQLERRRLALGPDGSIDFGFAESLALASILTDGTPIRLTGQDTERGTFSQRHLVLHDVKSGHTYTPLQHVPGAKASFAVYNSSLSEAGALGFEYGYSVHAPAALVLWEAQFGDFANAGQVIIDQFIAAARAKWRQKPSLVLLLPHGYEGQGPEHSSARLERYLQLAAQDNLRVVNPTTAGQYFHLLRRQAALLEDDPRPLVVMTPKSLLRHPRASSTLADLASGRFHVLIDDPTTTERRSDITRLVLCSGKVYVDLMNAESRAGASTVAVVRVEELYPFPADALDALVTSYPRLNELIWLQEEPENMGAWRFVAPHLRTLARAHGVSLRYSGRSERASPAVGSARVHAGEQATIVASAFEGVRPLQEA